MADSDILQTISASNDSTVAVEVFKTGLLRKRRNILFFERFSGELCYSPERPESSHVALSIDAKSVVCRDKWLKPKKQRRIADYARNIALAADKHPEIRFSSTRMAAKPLRGFVAECELSLRGVTRPAAVNVVFSPMSHGRLQIDADTQIRLTDFGIELPTSLFGLIGTKNEAMVHLLLWATVPALKQTS